MLAAVTVVVPEMVPSSGKSSPLVSIQKEPVATAPTLTEAKASPSLSEIGKSLTAKVRMLSSTTETVLLAEVGKSLMAITSMFIVEEATE